MALRHLLIVSIMSTPLEAGEPPEPLDGAGGGAELLLAAVAVGTGATVVEDTTGGAVWELGDEIGVEAGVEDGEAGVLPSDGL